MTSFKMNRKKVFPLRGRKYDDISGLFLFSPFQMTTDWFYENKIYFAFSKVCPSNDNFFLEKHRHDFEYKNLGMVNYCYDVLSLSIGGS